jgi:nucleolar protein 9
MVCVGSKAIEPKGSRQNNLIDGGSDDGSQKKRGRKDKGEKPRKGGHGLSKGPSVGKPKHGKDKKQRRSDDGKKGKGRGKDHRSGSSVVTDPGNPRNQDALPSSNTTKPAQNVLRYGYLSDCAMYEYNEVLRGLFF